MKRKLLMICMCMLLAATVSSIHAQEEVDTEYAKNAQSAYVMEYSSGTLVFEKNGDERLYPASMTKMMSLILVYEALDSKKIELSDMVSVSAYAASMGGSQIFLEPGEQMIVEDLLKSSCIASANDAIVALSELVAGSEEKFVMMMNDKAKKLKLENTHFMNATGLHNENHYSSAKDMAYIAQALIEIGGDDLLEITSTYEDYIREDEEESFWLVNTNKLLKQYEGVDGLKTGYTGEAQSCIATTAKKDNMRFIVVVMKEPDANTRNAEVIELLDYSFSLYEQVLLYQAGKVIDTKTLNDAKQENIELCIEEDVNLVYLKGQEVQVKEQEIKWLDKELPYEEGETLATLEIILNDGTMIETDLVSNEEVLPLSFFDIVLKSAQFVFF